MFNITLNLLTILSSAGYGLVMKNGYGLKIQFSTFSQSVQSNALLCFTPLLDCSLNLHVFNVSIESSSFSSGWQTLHEGIGGCNEPVIHIPY